MFVLSSTAQATTIEWTEGYSSDTDRKLRISIANFISIDFTGIIIIVGIIANFISFVIIVKSDLKRTSIGVYLAGLSVFDTILLVTTGTNNLQRRKSAHRRNVIFGI